MRSFRVGAFGSLVVATVAAFFFTQHLKVTTPLINGNPLPEPAAFNPAGGLSGPGEPQICRGARDGRIVDYRRTYVTFYLQKQPDRVAVDVVDTAGTVVATLAQNYAFRRTYERNPPGAFAWDGTEDSGRLAPDGTYYYRVVLLGQGRTFQLGRPVTVITRPPRPAIQRVTPQLISAPGRGVTIDYAGAQGDENEILVYRTDLPGQPQLAKSFKAPSRKTRAVWDGRINRLPAPAGTYQIAIRATDPACNTASDPAQLPPTGASATHSAVTVRTLAADPPLSSVPAGTDTSVYVYAAGAYRWALRRVGREPVLEHGSGSGRSLRVRIPPGRPGLYVLAIRSGSDRIAMPLIGGRSLSAARHKVLVVLPALTWQGRNPASTRDGKPDTLSAGEPVALERPFAAMPSGSTDEAALLGALDRAGLRYDLTSDISLLQNPSPILRAYSGVVLAGSEIWLPPSLSSALRGYAASGGHVLSLGEGSLQRGVSISGGQAHDPTPAAAADVFGAHPGAVTAAGRALTTVIADPLGVFRGTAGAFAGIAGFQAITPPAGTAASSAGTAPGSTSIVAFHLGRGEVVEAGLPDFGAKVAARSDFRQLTGRLWRLLGG